MTEQSTEASIRDTETWLRHASREESSMTRYNVNFVWDYSIISTTVEAHNEDEAEELAVKEIENELGVKLSTMPRHQIDIEEICEGGDDILWGVNLAEVLSKLQ